MVIIFNICFPQHVTSLYRRKYAATDAHVHTVQLSDSLYLV